ncbi:MAG TPA: adenylate/guanylate cyclase domain-containing protein [Gaiellaceae bacterium]|nr:adenylate/guanylate cyclase domain-containing protein [Gaiellaceae bacterium]
MSFRDWAGTAVGQAAAIGSLPSDSPDERLRKSALVLSSLLITMLTFIWVGTYAALGLWRSALIPLAYQVASLVGLAFFARTKRYAVYRASQLAMFLLLPFLLQWSLGGFVESGAVALWAFVAPLSALVFYGPRQAIAWFAGFLALVALSAAIDGVLPEPSEGIPSWLVVAFFALNIFGPSVTTFALLEHFVRSRDRAHRFLAAEQERSETLLLSIFPRPIAERLKVSQEVIAERCEEVSVLFADITGFTPVAERLPAEEVVVLLDEIFSAFDGLVTRHGLEKIKTIGDGYMVAAGIPTPRADHAEAAARLALAMRQTLAELPVAAGLNLRVGIDSGPVVAGVIGRTKFGYDLWGDTVNTASRMESHAPTGTIQVTERTYRRLEDGFVLEQRTGVVVKGKGEMTTYVLLAERPETSVAGARYEPASSR